MGAGSMVQTVNLLGEKLKEAPQYTLIVICGSNNKLYQQLNESYASDIQIMPIKHTSHMAWYLKACEVFITNDKLPKANYKPQFNAGYLFFFRKAYRKIIRCFINFILKLYTFLIFTCFIRLQAI